MAKFAFVSHWISFLLAILGKMHFTIGKRTRFMNFSKNATLISLMFDNYHLYMKEHLKKCRCTIYLYPSLINLSKEKDNHDRTPRGLTVKIASREKTWCSAGMMSRLRLGQRRDDATMTIQVRRSSRNPL
jgi:hypothetical protein